METSKNRISSFRFKPGIILLDKYEILSKLGSGWESEVYLVREKCVGVDRAAKFFFPQRNQRNRNMRFYARKLHKLRDCPILIQYHTQEKLDYNGVTLPFMVSEYVEGDLLSRFRKSLPGRRFTPFEGMHLLYALASGMEKVHQAHEYHGDLHDDNIIVRRRGLTYDLKLVDLYNWGTPSAENTKDDVCDMVRIFYDAVGGARHYSRQPQYVKNICCGLKRSLIIKKFRTAGHLRRYLETMSWEEY